MALRVGPSVLPLGTRIEPGAVAGYYIDFRSKVDRPAWPPTWYPWPGYHRYMAIAQWGLGAYEHYLLAGSEEWLAAALEAGNHLVAEQQRGGRRDGGWLEPREHPHTFHTPAPWLSAMAQGQCASLLVRLYAATGIEILAEASIRGLRPMRLATRDGGVEALLDGRPFPEEYPTDPPSFVLNGALFSIWGYYDVWRGLDEGGAKEYFLDGAGMLGKNLHRWDTGYWSRYDLYPHRVVRVCVASPFYHSLHINQLRAMALIQSHPEFERIQGRFEGYAASFTCRGRALAYKATFRLAIPRRVVPRMSLKERSSSG